MKNLISSLLDFTNIGMHKTRTEFSLDEILNSIKDILADKIEEKNAVFNILINENKLTGYKNDFQLLFLNLIENSLKFVSDTRNPIITLDCKIENDNYLYSITDNGIGIKNHNFEDIFNIFYKINS